MPTSAADRFGECEKAGEFDFRLSHCEITTDNVRPHTELESAQVSSGLCQSRK